MSGLSPVEPLLEAMKKYPPSYDEVLVQVGARIRTLGEAGKRHLAALICWKQAGQGDWISELMEMPDLEVRNVTRHALVARTDQERLDILAKLPGFARDEAIATVVLAAHNPEEYSVLDERSLEGLKRLGRPVATGAGQTVRYFDRVRELRDEARDSRPGVTARQIGQALWVIGGSK